MARQAVCGQDGHCMWLRGLDRPLTQRRRGERHQAGSNYVHVLTRDGSAPMMRNPQCWQYLRHPGLHSGFYDGVRESTCNGGEERSRQCAGNHVVHNLLM